MKVILRDKTVIERCKEGTTPDNIVAVRESYEEAGAVRDLFTKDNSKVIKILNDEDAVVATEGNLILNPGCSIADDGNGLFLVTITLGHKSEMEIMKDEIAELQEVVIDE